MQCVLSATKTKTNLVQTHFKFSKVSKNFQSIPLEFDSGLRFQVPRSKSVLSFFTIKDQKM